MRVRAYTPQDDDRVVEFLRVAAVADPTLRPVTPVGWRDFVGESWNRGGGDFVLAVDESDAIEGLLMSCRIEGDSTVRQFRIIVDPVRRGRGTGTRLLEEVARQDPAGSVVEQCNCESGWAAGQAFLEHRGFACEATSLDMVREGPPPDRVESPQGVRIRPDAGDSRDTTAWIALCEEGYRGTPGYSPLTAGDVIRHRAQAGSHLWVAEETGPGRAVLGHCRTVLWQGEEPWIDSVVVTARARGHGLGRALTVAGVRTLADAGHVRVRLNVRGDNAPARRIYEAVGFRVSGEVRTYRRRRPASFRDELCARES